MPVRVTDLPARIGDLVVDGLLGEGGMGRVYLCTDHALARDIAVKTLQPNLLSDSTMRERFVREARALARVKSAHVVTVHAIGEDAVVGPYVVMERLVGEDLLQRLHRRERLPVDEVVVLARAAAQGLAHAHDAGVVHRDIKPANLFCKRDGEGVEHLVITDFGLAKEVGGAATTSSGGALIPASQLTQADVIVGTPAYLAPELARGQAASPSSDLYALGATLFHLLVGDPPFVADSTIEVITKAVLETAPRASALVADVPAELDELLARLLEKRPEDRPASA
ncbi:MAG TPA: serine/threonine-protein kinase, partial [Myxococcota bacterium]